MADRPILFSAPMVRALLDGRKTQTRRFLPHPEYYGCPTGDCPHDRQEQCNQAMAESTAGNLKFAVGDRLWVKETWRAGRGYDEVPPRDMAPFSRIWFEADGCNDNADAIGRKARPSIFMPRWASRMTLTVTDVRVQLLNDCSEADALAEGVIEYEPTMEDPAEFSAFEGTDVFNNAVSAYRDLWNRINGAGAWEANPWVVAVSFDVRKGNIDGR